MNEENQLENSSLSSIEERLQSRKDKSKQKKKLHPIIEEIVSWIWSIIVAATIMFL